MESFVIHLCSQKLIITPDINGGFMVITGFRLHGTIFPKRIIQHKILTEIIEWSTKDDIHPHLLALIGNLIEDHFRGIAYD